MFKAIAENIYLDTPREWQPEKQNGNPLSLSAKKQLTDLSAVKAIPDLTGMDGSEVVPALENLGYKLKIEGVGKVQWQYPPAGSKVSTNRVIELKMG